MTDFRTEKDSLGDVNVPLDAWYAAQTQRAFDNFPISGIRFPRRFIEAIATVKLAAARANHELGILDSTICDAIVDAAEKVSAGAYDDQFVLDIFQTGSGTSTNMNTNEVISNLATVALGGEKGDKTVHPNDHVNMSQSSNDVIPTAMHVSTAVAIEQELIPALEAFALEMSNKAMEFDDVLKSGRTHLMDATPVRLGQEFEGFAFQIRQAIARIRQSRDELYELALGGTATGTGINCPTGFAPSAIKFISERTGLPFKETSNHFAAQSAKDAFVQTSGSLNTLAVALMKIVNDIRHLSSGPSSGIAEILLPAIQPGSSIMPGKVNPVMSEAVMMVCARVLGNHVTITTGGQHGNFELNVMMPVMTHAMLETISILSGALNAFRKNCLVGIKADRDRCQELLELNPSIATALNRTIGYDMASKVAKKSAAEKKSVRQVVLEMGLVDESAIDDLLDVRHMSEPGVPGQ